MKRLALTFCLPVVACNAAAVDLVVNLTDANNRPVENVIVYATPSSGVEGLTPNTNQLTINNENKKFAPYVAVMQKGQSIRFNNKDDITHHIYSVSGENRFEFKLRANSMKDTQVMENAEEIAMGCNIHDWMSGYTLVVDTPYFGKTDANGKLVLPVATEETYRVTLWHPQLDMADNRLEQTHQLSSANGTLNIKLPNVLLPVPEQSGDDDFDFLEEY